MNQYGRWKYAYSWYVTILLSFGYLVSLLDRFVIGLIFDPLKREFDLSDTQLGLLHGTGFVLLYIIAALPMGRLADTRNRRTMIAIGIALWSMATSLCAFASSFPTLLAARVLVGLGEASSGARRHVADCRLFSATQAWPGDFDFHHGRASGVADRVCRRWSAIGAARSTTGSEPANVWTF